MSNNASPRPNETDVHLVIRLAGLRLDYAACLTAALLYIQDSELHHCAAVVAVLGGDTAGLPRLPCERLYLEP